MVNRDFRASQRDSRAAQRDSTGIQEALNVCPDIGVQTQ